MLEKRESGRRRLHAAPAAHQQLDAEVLLELGDALADRRRLDVLLLGGARHRATVDDRDEEAKRLEVDVAHRRMIASGLPLRKLGDSEIPPVGPGGTSRVASLPALPGGRTGDLSFMPSFPERAIVREVGLRDVAGWLAGETLHGTLWRAGAAADALPRPSAAAAAEATHDARQRTPACRSTASASSSSRTW